MIKHLIPFLLILGILFSCNGKKNRENNNFRDEPAEAVVSGNREPVSVDSVEGTETESAEYTPCDSLVTFNDSVVEVIGIVQSSGIRNFDNFGFKADFQIESDEYGYYLLSDANLEPYWGKCVKVTGKMLHGGNTKMTDYSDSRHPFGRIPLRLESISGKDAGNCECLLSNKTFSANSKRFRTTEPNDTLTGYLFRHKRLAPDIAMDYSIELDDPIKHPEEESLELNQLVIYPNLPFDELNRIIENKIHIKTYGWVTGGYAETIVFQADSIVEI